MGLRKDKEAIFCEDTFRLCQKESQNINYALTMNMN